MQYLSFAFIALDSLIFYKYNSNTALQTDDVFTIIDKKK